MLFPFLRHGDVILHDSSLSYPSSLPGTILCIRLRACVILCVLFVRSRCGASFCTRECEPNAGCGRSMGGDRNAGLVIGFGLSLARAPGQILSIAQSAGSSRVRIMQVQARAAIAQLKSGDSRVLNLLAAARCAGWAKRDGASMLFLPECFGFLGQDSDQTISRADPPIVVPTDADCDLDTDFRNMPNFSLLLASTVFSHADGLNQVTYEDDDSRGRYDEEEVSILDGLQTIARESGLWISGGGMHESGAPNDPSSGRPRVYNSHVILDDKGRIKCVYRKSHMFDVSIPNKVNLKESATTAPGTDLVVCDSPVGRLGLSTCYDLRFPEMYVKLVQNGAEVLLVPSAFTVPTGKAHWHTLLTGK